MSGKYGTNTSNYKPQTPSTPQNFSGIPSASLFYLTITPDTKVYRYDVEVSQSYGQNTKLLTRSGLDVGKRILYRRLCEEIMRCVQNQNFGMGGGGKQSYVYDGKKNLYLLKDTGYVSKQFTIQRECICKDLSKFLSSDVIVTITKSNSFILQLDDSASALKGGLTSDHNLRNFFELLTTQSFYNQDKYDIVNSGLIFYRQIQRSNVYLSTQSQSGFKKGCRYIKGAGSYKNTPALVIDCVRGYLVHDPKRTVIFEGFTEKKMKDIAILLDKENRNVTFAEYYHQRKNRKIVDLDMYAIRCDVRENNYPPELFCILPYQRVPTSKMNQDISSSMISSNVINPRYRQENINYAVSQIDDEFLKKFGVTLCRTIISDQGLVRSLALPSYQFNGGNVVAPVKTMKNSTWQFEYPINRKNEYNRKNDTYKFFLPATVPKFVVLYTPFEGYEKQIAFFLKMGREHGMAFSNYHSDKLSDPHQLEELFKRYKSSGIGFVFLIDSRDTHQLLKRLEVKYEILTQQVKVDIFSKAGPVTMRNILLKTNVKCGGVNYVPSYPTVNEQTKQKLDYANGQFFIFSYDVAHPAPATGADKNKIFMIAGEEKKEDAKKIRSLEPSVVGYAANMARDAYNFIGNYAYQQSRKESINPDVLKRCLNYCLDKAEANRPKFKPTGVFILRDGVSEGEYDEVLKSEFEIIRKIVHERYKTECFKFLVVNKRHGKRFFSNLRDDANLCRGSIIDSVVVRPNFREFYLMPHTPLKGTAKVPQYAEIFNNMKMDDKIFEEFLHVMCNLHQVCLGGVSIPAPVYLAHELAKRGRHNYLQYLREGKQENLMDDKDYLRLTQNLSYDGLTSLNNWRFTA